MQKVRKVFLMTLGIAVLLALIAAILFPVFAKAEIGGKPTPHRQPYLQKIARRKQADFVMPITQAIRARDEAEVRQLWRTYEKRKFFYRWMWEDPGLRVEIAKFLASVGDDREAQSHLQLALNPPEGSWNKLEDDREATALLAALAEGPRS